MCGLVGMVAERDVAADIYDALTMLAAPGARRRWYHDLSGRQVDALEGRRFGAGCLSRQSYGQLLGRFGIGHVRYPTQGSSGTALAQPFPT